MAAPLNALTKKGIGIGKWNEDCDVSFENLKAVLTSVPIRIAPTGTSRLDYMLMHLHRQLVAP